MELKRLDGSAAVKAAPTGEAEVVIAVLGVVDYDGDVVAPGAIGEQTVPVLPAHNRESIVLGKARTREVGGRVVADIKFNLAVPEAAAWHSVLTFDVENPPAVQEYSWGYEVLRSRPDRRNDRTVRILERVKLDEISMVVRGASIGTTTLAVKCEGCAAKHDTVPALDAATEAVLVKARQNVDSYLAEKSARDAAAIAEVRRIRDRWVHATRVADAYDAFQFLTGHKYVEVDQSKVSPLSVGIAEQAAGHFAARLGLPCPEVRWFRQPQKTLMGRAFKPVNTIWLNADLNIVDVWAVAAHEVSHLRDSSKEGVAVSEARARAYERQARKELLNAR